MAVLTRVMVTGETANIYETIAIPHKTEDGKMVKPIVGHRFTLVTADMYQLLEDHEVNDCVRRACIFLGERRRPTGTECGIPLGLQRDRAVCSYAEVPVANYLEATFSREYLVHGIGGKALSMDLFCPMLTGSAVQHVTVTGSGTLKNPPGCYYSDAVSQVRYYGPIGRSKSVVTLQDTQNMRLHYESSVPNIKTTVPHIDIPEPPPIQSVSTSILERKPMAVADKVKFNLWIYVTMAVIGVTLLTILGVCAYCVWRLKYQYSKVATNFGSELATLARRMSATQHTLDAESGALRALTTDSELRPIVRMAQPLPPERTSPPVTRTSAYLTFGHQQEPTETVAAAAAAAPPYAEASAPPAQAPSTTPGSVRRVQFREGNERGESYDTDDEIEDIIARLPPPAPSLSDFMQHLDSAALARAVPASVVAGRNGPPVPPRVPHTNVQSPSGVRRHPPATRATRLDEDTFVPSPFTGRHQRTPSGSKGPKHK